jgi:adenylate kinase
MPDTLPAATPARPLFLALFGKPGSGKGTQSVRLAAALHLPIFSTGNVLRQKMRDIEASLLTADLGDPATVEMRRIYDGIEPINQGQYADEHVVRQVSSEALGSPAMARGAILDGSIRNLVQAKDTNVLLARLGHPLPTPLVFDVPDDEIVARLSTRLICGACQQSTSGGTPGDACQHCPGTLERRPDDAPAAIRERLAIYQARVEPVLAFYADSGSPAIRINGVGPESLVTARALAAPALLQVAGPVPADAEACRIDGVRMPLRPVSATKR